MPPPTAASLLRDVGLLADGPLPWGRQVPARTGGVFLVELPAASPTAPIELTRVGKWLERVPALTLDGAHPTSRALAGRLASFWLPSQTVLYIGSTEGSIGGRVAAIEKTALGDRRPHGGGHWLKVLTALPSTRVWWATTDAAEEYEDALLAAFAAGLPDEDLAKLPDRDVVLPFANLRRPTGERKATGLRDALLPEPKAPVPPPTRIVHVPDGDAEGARGEPPESKRRAAATTRRMPAPTSSRAGGGGGERTTRGPSTSTPPVASPGGPSATLTAEGAARLQAELRELTEVRRPEVIGRIRAAKELGDLKENADYTAAREEQSFLEGRVQALEARLRDAVIAAAPVAGAGADLGSQVVVEIDGETDTYTLVGSAEADPGKGRLSVASPVGRALLGAREGDEVAVQTPRGTVRYRVVSVG